LLLILSNCRHGVSKTLQFHQISQDGKSQRINGHCARDGYEVNWTLHPGYGAISHR
jgi:hypothetical protein